MNRYKIFLAEPVGKNYYILKLFQSDMDKIEQMAPCRRNSIKRIVHSLYSAMRMISYSAAQEDYL